MTAHTDPVTEQRVDRATMNGWEMFYESLRYYEHRPEGAICKDFIEMLPFVERIYQ